MLTLYGIQYDNHNEIVHININRREFILLYNNTYMYEKQKKLIAEQYKSYDSRHLYSAYNYIIYLY